MPVSTKLNDYLNYGAYRLFGGDGEKRSSQLSEGTRVEKKEHGKDFDALAKQVAKAHLKEDPRYYTHLKAMEQGRCTCGKCRACKSKGTALLRDSVKGTR